MTRPVLVLNMRKMSDVGFEEASLLNAGYELVYSDDPDTPPVLMHNPETPTRRERIATALFAGILASGPFSGERMLNGDLLASRAAPLALELADKLIAGLNGK